MNGGNAKGPDAKGQRVRAGVEWGEPPPYRIDVALGGPRGSVTYFGDTVTSTTAALAGGRVSDTAFPA